MSSAAERAEARRKAILAKRGDRLAKLTTSARGEEGVYLGSDNASSRSKNFLGEGSPQVSTPSRVPISPSSGPITSKLTTALPSAPSPSITPESHFSGIDDSVWSPELQERFRRAPVNIDSPFSNPSGSMSSGVSASGRSPRSLGSDGQADADPITEMVASLSAGASSSDMFNFLQQVRQGTQATSPEVDTLQRDKAIRRIIQLVTAWLLLAYFVFFLEPSVYRSRVGSLDVGRWTRWAVLGENRNMLGLLQTFIVQPQPAFFWAFIALEAVLHFDSLRNVFPIRSVGLRQDVFDLIKMILAVFNTVTFFLNDLGSIIFGLGVIVFFAGCVTPK
ncbi:hypothetical protein Ac2012v2_000103 [Leucoagaricus gongylophorus]